MRPQDAPFPPDAGASAEAAARRSRRTLARRSSSLAAAVAIAVLSFLGFLLGWIPSGPVGLALSAIAAALAVAWGAFEAVWLAREL